MKQSRNSQQIEVSGRYTSDFVEATAKFTTARGHVKTLTIWGSFSSVRTAKQAVLEQARRIVDNSR